MDSKKDEPKVPYQRVPSVGESSIAVKSSGRYILHAQHVFAGDRLLEVGTEVGDGTPYPWPGPPSPLMEGVDDAGRQAVEKLHNDLYNSPSPWDYTTNPDYAIHEERRKEQEKETESAPVSHAQAVERDKEWKGPVPVPPTSSPSIGGSRVAGVSMPALNVDKPRE